jgi:hypothetical protein
VDDVAGLLERAERWVGGPRVRPLSYSEQLVADLADALREATGRMAPASIVLTGQEPRPELPDPV